MRIITHLLFNKNKNKNKYKYKFNYFWSPIEHG